jgi:hypothetical protein
MIYTLNAASGDAGEYFFAYQIADVLKWPCRLLDIDIGIDAQVEVIDMNRKSNGRFIAVQVKARLDDGKSYRYVTEAQLAYWLELDVPVFVVLVNLAKKTMYVHRISKKVVYHRTPEGRVRIDFDMVKEIFSSATAARFAKASDDVAMEHILPLLEEVNQGAEVILEYLRGEVNDSDRLFELMRSRVALQGYLSQASALVDAMGVGVDEYNAALSKLGDGLDQLAAVFVRYKIHVDRGEYHAEVSTFLDELR